MVRASTLPRFRLKEARQAKGTQRKVAAELGITETHLRELENGNSVPGTRLFKRMEHYFEISSNDLFPDLDEPDFYLKNAQI